MQRPWARWAVFAAAVLLAGGTGVLLASRGDDVDPVIATDGPSTTSPAVALPTASTRPAAPSLPVVPPLPSVGVAVETADGVQLVDVDGNVLATLDGYTLDPNWRPDLGVRVVRDEGTVLSLDTVSGKFVVAGAAPTETVESRPPIPPPPGVPEGTRVIGHWRWSVPSPVGSTRLAQWSWECEVPLALLVDERNIPRSPFGGSWVDAPSSVALGWTDDGRALIYVWGNPACGTGMRQGVYLVPVDGEAAFLIEGRDAQSWTRFPRLAPATTLPTWPAGVADQLVLTGTAVGQVPIGADAELAIEQISEVLGRPTSDQLVSTLEIGFPTEVCGIQIRSVTWGGFGVMFNTEGGTQHGLLQWGLSGDQPLLRLESGVQLGMTHAAVQARVPDLQSAVGGYADSTVFEVGSPPNAVRFRFADTSDGAPLAELRGGNTHCIGD